jgi:hypothetical protein
LIDSSNASSATASNYCSIPSHEAVGDSFADGFLMRRTVRIRWPIRLASERQSALPKRSTPLYHRFQHFAIPSWRSAMCSPFVRTWLAFACGLGLFLLGSAESWSGQKKKAFDFAADGEITKDSEPDNVRNGSLRKIYKVTMEKGKSYQIDMSTQAFDAYLRLEDAKNNQIAEDDDSGGNLDARIVFTAPRTEEYRVIATTFAAGAVGKYKLTIKEQSLEVKPPPPPEKYKGEALKLVASKANFAGKLSESEQLLRGKFLKVFEIDLEEGKTYRIDMKSKDFDAYLILHDREGNVVAANDDISPQSTNARIQYKAAKSGPYTLLATSLLPKEAGNFELSIAPISVKENKKVDPPPPVENSSFRSSALTAGPRG